MSRRVCGLGVDYATTILPLLLSMTILSSRLIALNVTVALLAWVFGMTTPRRWYPKRVTKPRGRWLAESDSEDEGSGGQSTPTRKPKVKLPSQALAEANAAELQRRTSGSTSALASPISGDEGDGRRRRRHSPSGPAAVIDIGASPPSTPNPRRSPSVKREKLPQPDPPANTHLPHSRAGRPVRPRTHLPFLSVYRAHMMVMTVLAILAVDFAVFPRILGKTEDWGTGLMDVGVGSFVFSLGIVSSKAFATTRRGKMLRTLAGTLRRAVPVLALGFVRLLMVKGVEYPVSPATRMPGGELMAGTYHGVRRTLELLLHPGSRTSACDGAPSPAAAVQVGRYGPRPLHMYVRSLHRFPADISAPARSLSARPHTFPPQ